MKGRTRGRLHLGIIVAVAMAALPATRARGGGAAPVEGQVVEGPVADGPFVVEAGPRAAVIVDGQANVAVSGDVDAQVRACGLTPGCIAFWEEGVGVVIVLGFTDVAGGGLGGEFPPRPVEP